MNFKRIQSLWKESAGERDGSGEDPSEVRNRTFILAFALLAGPPLLFLFYYKTMFPGLFNQDALDFAQLGRHLSDGHGFVTYVLRPLALSHGNNPLGQPDVIHGPFYPFLLALAFGLHGATDQTVSMVSGLFYLLTIPVLYVLGVRVFNRAVALLTVLIYTTNALMLEYAACGLHITLFIFLMTSLLLSVYNIAVNTDTDQGATQTSKPFPTGQYVLAGILTALLYLTDPIFFWICPIILVSAYTVASRQKGRALIACGAPMLLLILPWMLRNAAVTGNPVFGLRGMELWMYTKGVYPGDSGYRKLPADMIANPGLFQAVVHKIMLGAGLVIQQFPQVTASWILAFFLPCLLFRFTSAPTNVLRRVMIWCLLGMLIGSLAFQIWMPLFVAVIPVMIVFSVGYLLHLTQQAQLTRPSLALVTSLVALAAIYPLLSDMVLKDKPLPAEGMSAAVMLAKSSQKTDVILSDQPSTVAWFADRPSMAIPADDDKVADVKERFPGLRLLFLTRGVRVNSPVWASIYDAMLQWNQQYLQRKEGAPPMQPLTITAKGLPLLDALYGFTAMAPTESAGTSVVIAAAPAAEQQIGLSTRPGGSTSP